MPEFAKMLLSRFHYGEDGQTLVEYGLIVALLTIAVIAVLGTFGSSVNDVWDWFSNLF